MKPTRLQHQCKDLRNTVRIFVMEVDSKMGIFNTVKAKRTFLITWLSMKTVYLQFEWIIYHHIRRGHFGFF